MNRASLYDWELRHVHGRDDQDLAFYRRVMAEHPGPVLELACGTGRVGGRLADEGADVTGLDLDPQMLAVASARHPTATWVEADMVDFDLGRRFAVVAIPYNSVQLLDESGRLGCLRSAARHLDADGRLALEVTDFQAGVEVDRVDLMSLASDADTAVAGALVHDRAARTTTYHRVVECEGRRRVDHVVLRSLAEGELRADLNRCGLRVERVERDGYRVRAVAFLALRAGDDARRVGAGSGVEGS